MKIDQVWSGVGVGGGWGEGGEEGGGGVGGIQTRELNKDGTWGRGGQAGEFSNDFLSHVAAGRARSMTAAAVTAQVFCRRRRR